jgi:hypothetical protein
MLDRKQKLTDIGLLVGFQQDTWILIRFFSDVDVWFFLRSGWLAFQEFWIWMVLLLDIGD